MAVAAHDGVEVIKPGQTYVGKQGFTYGAGASAETIGAQKVCMNVLPMPPGAVAKAHYHKGIETIALICSKANAPFTTATNWRSASWCDRASRPSSRLMSRTHRETRSGKPCTWIVVHSSGSDQDGIGLARLDHRESWPRGWARRRDTHLFLRVSYCAGFSDAWMT